MGWSLTEPVFLVGFMGSGKTTVARELARRFSLPSADADDAFAERTGRTPAQAIEASGEAAFRREESRVLAGLAKERPCLLVSCGGGVVVRQENVDTLAHEGFTVWLCASAETVMARVGGDQGRPLLPADAAATVEAMHRREAAYRAASRVQVDTDGRTPAQAAREVARALEDAGVLVRTS